MQGDGACQLPPVTALVPVFVYIHGGSLMTGSGNWEKPAAFAIRTGSIAVAINYRLNIHGFLATSALSALSGTGTSGNYGILDQQLALRWVRDNVAAFGGDPARVTLGGQSSGGTSIFALLCSPASRGLFSAAIALSGSPNITIGMAAAEAQNAAIPAAVGCGGGGAGNASAEVACLRAAPAAVLAAAIPAAWNTPSMFALPQDAAGYGLAGLPVVDGHVLTLPLRAALAVGLVDVPLIAGNMGQELGAPGSLTGANLTSWRAYLGSALSQGWGLRAPALADGVYAEYLADAESAGGPARAYASFYADYTLSCAFRQLAVDAKAPAGGLGGPPAFASPMYTYINSWQPSVPVNGATVAQAYHTWDYSAAFENWPRPTDPAHAAGFPGPTDLGLALFLQRAWGQLIHNGSLDPATTAGWASVEAVPGFPASTGTLRLGSPDLPPFEPPAFVSDLKAAACDFQAGFGFVPSNFWWCN